jgi:hypothetical protein
METSELELLKKVLPEPWEVVNDGLGDGHELDDLAAVWDGDDCQHRISTYTSAKEVLDWIMKKEREWAKASGANQVRWAIKEALCIREDINHAISAAKR